jgi:error-prone DNA polymerase
LEEEAGQSLSLRIGLNYARGMRSTSIEAMLTERNLHGPFVSVDDLAARAPELNRKELVLLAQIGALNNLERVGHRRDALWQVEEAGRPVGPLLRGAVPAPRSKSHSTPLAAMTTDERLAADYAGVGLTTGPHPMAYQRDALRSSNIYSAMDLPGCRNNASIRIAGCVIARQRPGTAKGFVFLSLEDETGIANIILTPDVFERDRLIVTRNRFLLISGIVQNTDGVIHVKAQQIEPLLIVEIPVSSYDFH